MKLTFLGTGTSQGVPMIGCDCEVCHSSDSRDKRYRCSVLVVYDGAVILVDAGPDFRSQLLGRGLRDVDAILMTHNHKDHTAGLDDVRAFNYLSKTATEIYCEKNVEESFRGEFPYAFKEIKYPGIPEWNIHIIDEQPFTIQSRASGKAVEIIPIRGIHYKLPVLGFRFGNIAYCTDMNLIPDSEFAKLEGLEHFIISTVRRGHHVSHFSLEEAVDVAKRVGAKHSWLTHLSHQLPRHKDLCNELPAGILPAYDGLVISCQ